MIIYPVMLIVVGRRGDLSKLKADPRTAALILLLALPPSGHSGIRKVDPYRRPKSPRMTRAQFIVRAALTAETQQKPPPEYPTRRSAANPLPEMSFLILLSVSRKLLDFE